MIYMIIFKVNWCESFNSFVLQKLMVDSMRFIILRVVLLGIYLVSAAPDVLNTPHSNWLHLVEQFVLNLISFLQCN